MYAVRFSSSRRQLFAVDCLLAKRVIINLPGLKVLSTRQIISSYDVSDTLHSNETYENAGSGVMWIVM
jgi:hypothetical protein